MKRYELVFDEVIVRQLKRVGKDIQFRLSKMFDKMELLGPSAGELIDSQLFLYEIKSKHPPIRLYFRHAATEDELHVFEFEMKTSEERQQKTINKLKKRAKNRHLSG